MGPKSAIDVGVEVVAGLIAVAAQRERAIDTLRSAVEAVIEELDPANQRNRDATWFHDLDAWVRLDPFDRLRKSYEDLMLVEAQAADIVNGLRSMLNPMVVRADLRVLTPRQAYEQLGRLAEHRAGNVKKLKNAERRVNQHLRPDTSKELRRALREIEEEEARGRSYRERLGRLLSMADLAAS